MASLTISASTDKAELARPFTLPDEDFSRVIASWQAEVDLELKAAATREQVFHYIVEQWLKQLSARAVAHDNAILSAAIVSSRDVAVTYLTSTGDMIAMDFTPKTKTGEP